MNQEEYSLSLGQYLNSLILDSLIIIPMHIYDILPKHLLGEKSLMRITQMRWFTNPFTNKYLPIFILAACLFWDKYPVSRLLNALWSNGMMYIPWVRDALGLNPSRTYIYNPTAIYEANRVHLYSLFIYTNASMRCYIKNVSSFDEMSYVVVALKYKSNT